MLSCRRSLALPATLLLTIFARVDAVPSVNVALRTAFGAPPYLVELLETAADENPTSYFPLLDRIADGFFDGAKTDRALYDSFRSLLQTDGHLVAPEDLSSFDFALSIHSAAPRIEAHHQFYNTSVGPLIGEGKDDGCESWVYVPFSGQRWCSPELDEKSAQALGTPAPELKQLPFDRVLGEGSSGKPTVVYADITSLSFRQFHKTISRTAREGRTSYRVRYKPSEEDSNAPLAVSGYGVELALKRTDYIVIDDRQAEEKEKGDDKASDEALKDGEVSDLRPLTSSELRRLGLKVASYVMSSDEPIEILEQVSRDFPKYSSAISTMNISDDFLQEHRANREALLPPGYNVIWINGVQIMARDFDAYNVLDLLRRERKMINGVRELGLTGPQAIDLLSHEAITQTQIDSEAQRYDWRDVNEGGDVILWLNDVEKDKRYADWSGSIMALLQRTYPGQLPPVKRDVHNLVVPVDFASYADIMLLTESLQNFVKRGVPIRIGMVPYFKSPASEWQARTVYHLMETYGLSATLDYLDKSVKAAGRKYGPPQEAHFTKATADRKLRRDKEALPLQQILESESYAQRLRNAKAYMTRLARIDATPPVFINGVPVTRNEEWLQSMSQKVGLDARIVGNAVYQEQVTEADYLPDLFLANAALQRNPLIVPEDDKTLRHLDLAELTQIAELPSLSASADTVESELVHLTVAVDLDSEDGFATLMEALRFQKSRDNVELAVLHAPIQLLSTTKSVARLSKNAMSDFAEAVFGQYNERVAKLETETPSYTERAAIYKDIFATLPEVTMGEDAIDTTWLAFRPIVSAAGIKTGEKAIILNGRVVGPASDDTIIEEDDFEALLAYERKQRLLPASAAVKALNIGDKATTPAAFAKISNLIALSLVSDVPEGIFEAPPTVRTAIFKPWNSTYTAIKVGEMETSNIQIFASIDPASETAQRWIPILKSLSELDGIYTCLYLNPKDRIEELPIKRFYRHVLESKPTFDEDGALLGQSAHFSGLPADALLNMGMDLPASWLVAPEESIHDLDNIKLSAVKGEANIEAIYELEHILIEGHSRDVTIGPAPRGAQLVLGTEQDPHFADTIIMANLGYFQFKANPGIYNLALQKGRSEDIFNIDSAGTLGYAEQAGDDTTEIALMSFRGATIFPRLSRKTGMEEEDVLEAPKSTVEELAGKADKMLAQAGLPGAKGYLSKAAKLGNDLLGGSAKAVTSSQAHADINIFSVASGHLYERMLNIMMVSVMKHTKHSVKFWFVEQFLSPSFKAFLPTMAEEYGFKYEMVTYKWPHWLRGQKEKQREIWGYKILFLDVLFPLNLDKVIFVDADQIVRTDMYDLVQHDLKGAPYGFTPMCDSRTEMEGFRFWKQGYWKNFLRGLPYHISALYVVDLKKFRQIAAGDRLRGQYHQLSADPASLSNLDQDLPNHMQMVLPIHSLPQEWLWCETWCSDESLKDAKTIDLCNNPQTKEPKLDRARRQVPEWTVYDDEIAAVAKKHREHEASGQPVADDAADAGGQGEQESIQEQLQREDAERERKKHEGVKDEL